MNPDATATLHPPLLAYSIVLCRQYGYPEHLAEDFVQEMWLRAFRRIDESRSRDERYHYLRTRLRGLFLPQKRAKALHSMWRDEAYPADLSHADHELVGTD